MDRCPGSPCVARPSPARLVWLAPAAALCSAVFFLALAHAAPAPDSASAVNSYYGAFSTRLPITLPAFHGLEPNLELAYTSVGAANQAGVGFTLDGLPSIERVGVGRGAPRYDTTDGYVIDGQELVACASGSVSPSCTAGGTHSTRIENYQRIRFDSAANTWTITRKDGTRLVFNSVFSAYRGGSLLGTFRWGLSSLIDTSGNTVTITWWCDGSPAQDCYPDAVSYNSYGVKLYRETRPDPVSFANGSGTLGRTAYRLKSIQVTAPGGVSVRAYKLNYTTSASSNRSLLSSIQQYGRDVVIDAAGAITGGTALPSTSFGWSGTSANRVLQYTGGSSTTSETYWTSVVDSGTYHGKVLPTDINGDGKADLVMMYQDVNNRTTVAHHWISDGNKLQYTGASSTTTETYWTSVVDSGTYRGRVFAMDVNGDGKGDVVMVYQDVNNRTTVAYHWISDGNKLQFAGTTSTGETYWSSVVDSPTYHGKAFATDINGDGKDDLVMIYQDVNNRSTVAHHWISNGSKLQYTGTTSTGETYWSSVVDSPTYHGKAFAMDVNGDGKGDVVMVYQDVNNRSTVAYHWISDGNKLQFTGTTSTGETYWSSVIDSGTYHGKAFAMDINGDGKGDLVMIYQDVNNRTTAVYHWLSDGSKLQFAGTSSTGSETYWTSVVDSGTYHGKVFTSDVNGDGRADLVMVYQDASNRTTLAQHWISDGSKLQYSASSSTTSETYWTSVVDSGTYHGQVLPMDVNGDGRNDLVMIYQDVNNRTTLAQHWIAAGPMADLATSITSSLGGTTALQYTPSTAWSNTYLPQGAVIPTLSSKTVSDGRGAQSTSTYSYQGGLWSPSERRFLGFRRATEVLDAAGNYSETYYHQHVGCIAKPEVTYYRNASGSLYKYSTFNYSENTAPPYTSLMTERWEYECNLGSTCQRVLLQIGYDQYGNGYLTQEYGNYDVAGDERTSLRGLYPNTSAYVVGLPAYENIYTGIGTAGTLLKQTLYEYDGNTTYAAAPSRGLVTRQLAWNNQTGSYSTRRFAYDAWSNRTSETDELGYTSTTAYDATYHVHPTQRCNALGQCSTQSWDNTLEVIQSETDINGGTTSYTHDALARPLVTTLPSGSTESYSYYNFGSPTTQRVRRTVSDGSPDGLWTDLYEDGLGRRYKTVREGGLTEDILYNDASSRIWKKSAVYASGETPQYQTFAFDGIGRLRTITNADGSVGQRVYGNGYIATYDELGNEKVTYLDAYGQTAQVREKNGTAYQYTTYQYDLLGNLVRLTNAAGNVTTVSWDSLGRKLSGCDPDTGCSSYTYDAAGRMLSVRDAKGQTTTLSYDAVGRRLTKTLADGRVMRFTYDEAGHGAGKGTLTSTSDPAGSESRSYDSAGRLTSFNKCISSVCYTTGYSYDSAGRLASITYPDGEVVPYGYDAAGRLASVGGYVTGLAYNGRGQITAAGFANGTTTSYAYNSARQWLASALVTGPGGNIYQAGYGYDGAGRVTSMSSTTHALSNASYGYDTLGRLTAVSGSQSQSFSYDAIGNILSNSAMGSYQYTDAAHRHAVTAAGSTPYSYDVLGNLTAGGTLSSLTWDSDNRLSSSTASGATTNYLYDASGQRVMTSGSAGTTRYFSAMVEQGPSGLVKYYFAGPLAVARRDASGVLWLHQDHLGSVRALSNAAGQRVASYEYGAFGALMSYSGSADIVRRYGAHTADPSGLIYMNARYYHPGLGRFISPDAVVPGADNPQALNRYAYVLNNPVANADPTGHVPVVAAVATALSVGVASGFAGTAFVISVVGAATVTAGYVLKDPVLSTIGSILLGAASAYTFGAGFLGEKLTAQAAFAGGGVSALTSPLSPLDPKLKQAIGLAYTAQSLLYETLRLNENIEKGADQLRDRYSDADLQTITAEKGAKLDSLSAENKALINDPSSWKPFQRAYGEAIERATGGALKAGEAIALNPTGGLVGPDGGFLAQVLDVTTGWIPGIRAHSVLHDAAGFLRTNFGVGPGYLYLGYNFFGLSKSLPLAGQIEGIAGTGGASVSAIFPRLF